MKKFTSLLLAVTALSACADEVIYRRPFVVASSSGSHYAKIIDFDDKAEVYAVGAEQDTHLYTLEWDSLDIYVRALPEGLSIIYYKRFYWDEEIDGDTPILKFYLDGDLKKSYVVTDFLGESHWKERMTDMDRFRSVFSAVPGYRWFARGIEFRKRDSSLVFEARLPDQTILFDPTTGDLLVPDSHNNKGSIRACSTSAHS